MGKASPGPFRETGNGRVGHAVGAPEDCWPMKSGPSSRGSGVGAGVGEH